MTVITTTQDLMGFYRQAESRAAAVAGPSGAKSFQSTDRATIAEKLVELRVDVHLMAQHLAGRTLDHKDMDNVLYAKHLARLKKFAAERREGSHRLTRRLVKAEPQGELVAAQPVAREMTKPTPARSTSLQAQYDALVAEGVKLGITNEEDVCSYVRTSFRTILTTQKLDGVAERLAKEMLIHQLDSKQKEYVLNRTRILTA